nr:MAG TPA: hypothetical protein [Caudoviricetes sp.]
MSTNVSRYSEKNIHLFCLNDLIYMPFRVIYIHNKKRKSYIKKGE